MPEAWYDEVEPSAPLTQGDILTRCPLVGWAEGPVRLTGVAESEALRKALTLLAADVVVMTQACDLEHDKVPNVVLCPHVPLAEYKTAWEELMKGSSQNPTARAWTNHCEDIRDGYVWNLAFLNAGSAGTLSTNVRVVDFHDVFTVPRSFVESLLEQRSEPRLRLRPPYREHLSQAFARFFMRVGLPVPIETCW